MIKSQTSLVNVVVGAQWGDESKGAIVDLLSEHVDIVARYNGGNNAGHTIVAGGVKYSLHSIPTGILRGDKTCYIGNGCVLDPENFHNECENLKSGGVKIDSNNLKIANNLPLILSLHKDLDKAREGKASSADKIGTTGRGIGPAYEDKVGRRALRVIDMVMLHSHGQCSDVLRGKIEKLLDYHNVWRTHFGLPEKTVDDIISEMKKYAELISLHATDVWRDIHKDYISGKKILLEAGQGVLLDIDHGTYPFVTSSNTTANGCYDGLGFAPDRMNVIGVIKAYTTRVGNGPFPTQIKGQLGEKIAEIGKEWGTTTGRKRACGWLDLVALRQTVIISGINSLALAKVDVFDGFDEIKVAVAYKIGDKVIDFMPSNLSDIDNLEPVYKTIKCWKNSKVSSEDEFAPELIEFINMIESYVGVPVSIVSCGPERERKIIRSGFSMDEVANIAKVVDSQYQQYNEDGQKIA